MPDRREVLKAALAGSAVPVSVLAAPSRPLAVERAVYDERFEAGRGYARAAEARGWPVRAIRGDVTEVWFDDLGPLWKRRPAPVAGVTTAASLFCLERLAWDAGLRVVSRAAVRDEPLVAWLIAPRPGAAA